MATKLELNNTVEREVLVTVMDHNDVERALVVELNHDGTVNLRLKGMKRVVTVDLLGALDLTRDGADAPVVAFTNQPTTAKKRTMAEHLRGQ